VALSDRDQLSRKLRISLVDHCNFRCVFCHNEGQGPLGREKVHMSVAEIVRLCAAALRAGVREIKLTGGEPLLYRHGDDNIVSLVKAVAALRERAVFGMSITTNGLLLSRHASRLAASGLDRATVSLHTLDETTLRASILPGGSIRTIERVISGLHAAKSVGLSPMKVNTVLIGPSEGDRGNIAELPGIIDLCRDAGVGELRLYTLIAHRDFAGDAFERRYRFWDREMLSAVMGHVAPRSPDAATVTDAALAFFRDWKDVMYPKPVFQFGAGSPMVSIEPMAHGRFADEGLSAEGPYALRLSASGQLRGALEGDKAVPLLAMLRSGADDRALTQAFLRSRESLLPEDTTCATAQAENFG
jgi:molybdenum cofactor biosynthesis enzyme MoaA